MFFHQLVCRFPEDWQLLIKFFLWYRGDSSVTVLVCSKGGGGLLEERMLLVVKLWEANIKVGPENFYRSLPYCTWFTFLLGLFFFSCQAEFVPLPDPSLTEQYEYANEHDIKCLVIITDSGVSQKDSVKVSILDCSDYISPSQTCLTFCSHCGFLQSYINWELLFGNVYYLSRTRTSNQVLKVLSFYRKPVTEPLIWYFTHQTPKRVFSCSFLLRPAKNTFHGHWFIKTEVLKFSLSSVWRISCLAICSNHNSNHLWHANYARKNLPFSPLVPLSDILVSLQLGFVQFKTSV